MAKKSPSASIARPMGRGRAKQEGITFQNTVLSYSAPGRNSRLSEFAHLSGHCLKKRNLITNQHIAEVPRQVNNPAETKFRHKNTSKTRKFQYFANFIAGVGMPPALVPPMLVVN